MKAVGIIFEKFERRVHQVDLSGVCLYRMNVFKRLFSLFIVFLLILGSTKTFISAEEMSDSDYEYYTYAEKLSEVGVFVGTGSGYELSRSPNRIEGLIILIRLLGQEEEALTGDYKSNPFRDVPVWAEKYADYAYEKGLTIGTSETTFGSLDELTSHSFMTFILRALGYDDGAGDFNWSEALEFSESLEIIDSHLFEQLKSQEFLRNHVAKVSYDALLAKVKNSEDTLASHLVRIDAVDHDIAVHIGVLSSDLVANLDNLDDLSGAGDIDSSYVDENGQTPLLGPATASQETLTLWAVKKGMSQEGLDLIPIYYELCQTKGLNPVIQYVQMCLETGYLYKVKSQSGVDASYHNPCGLKISEGGEDYKAMTFMKFDSWYDGIDAHTDHSALYAGVSGYPKADTKDPRHFSWLLGRVKTVEGLSGTWAEADYHIKVLKLYQEVLDMK